MDIRYSDKDWNEKRLSDKNLRGLNFQGKNLESFNFENSDIRGVNFTGVNLKGANFQGVKAGLQPWWVRSVVILLFLINILLVICLVLAGQIAGDRIVPKYNPGIYPDVTWDEYWVTAIILGIFLLFLISTVRKGLGTAFLITSIAVVLVISFRLNHALIQVLLGFPFRDITVSLTSSVIGSVVGIGTGSVAVAIAIDISVAKIVGGNLSRNIVIFGAFFTTLLTAAFLSKSGAATISAFIGWLLALVGVVLGIYIASLASSRKKEYSLAFDIAVFIAAIGGTNFQGADLTDVDFTGATLKNTDFRGAKLTRTCWFNAKQLDLIRAGTTYLQNVQVRQLVSTKDGTDKSFERLDLRELDLREANLENASFIDADFYQANLKGANLSEAILVRTNFERVDLRNACLTGSCIQDWVITEGTKLDGIVCDYVSLKWDDVKKKQRDPMPPRGKFKKGGFVLFIKHILETIDIYHDRNINPRLALTVLRRMSKDYHEPLDIMALGKRGDKVFIKVKLSEDVEQERFKEDYYSRYDEGLKFLSSNPKQLPSVDELVENRIAEIASEEPSEISSINVTHIEYINTPKDVVIKGGEVTVESIETGGDNFNLSGSFGVGVNKGEIKTEKLAGIINEAKQQNLVEAAAEIQQLLKQLEETNPTETETVIAAKAADEIRKNPTLKARVIGALKSGGKEAFKEAVDNPLVNVLIAIIEGWQEAE